MTIPQGDIRGPQSISERRKIPYGGCVPVSEQIPTHQTPVTLGEDTISICKLPGPVRTQNFRLQEEPFLITGSAINLTGQSLAGQCPGLNGHLEVKVTVVPPQNDPTKSSYPLLDILNGGANTSASPNGIAQTKKLSLNLPRPFQRPHLDIKPAEKTRKKACQSQKSCYQRVPQEDPSPLSPITEIISQQQQFGQINQAFKCPLKLSTHSAQIHAPFHDSDLDFSAQSASLESSSVKKVLFAKQRALTRSDSAQFRSLDDLSLVDQGGGREKGQSFSSVHRSASSEELPGLDSESPLPSGAGQGTDPSGRRQAGQTQGSVSSPSHCCLVSVSRVPMAAAASHLTLDSDYQTVRLAVLGAPGVGKSSIVRQFVMQQFLEEYVPTEQRQIFCPAVIINDHLYEVRIIDCPYIPYFPVNSLYEWTDFRGYGLRNATAYVLVYDITSEESFEYIKSLRLQILESRSRHDVPIFVVGNKHDLAEERAVPRREVREIANLVKKQWKCGYIECSAKYNWHIMLLFKELMKTVDYIDYGHKPTSMRVQDALRRNRCLIL